MSVGITQQERDVLVAAPNVDGPAPLHVGVVKAAVLDRLGVQIEVTSASVKFAGSQTTGGVKKKYKLKIAFEGTVTEGPDSGSRVKGTIKTKGSF